MSRLLEFWRALDLDFRDVEFYGGLLLVGFAPFRLQVVGGILVAHAWSAPLLVRRA